MRRSQISRRMGQVRRQLLEDALRFYRGFLEERTDDPAVRHGMANVRKSLGDTYMLLGRKESASKLYLEAAELLEELATENPDEPTYRSDLALVYRWLGVWGWERLKHCAQAVEYAERLVAQHPDNLFYRVNLAHCYSGLGTYVADPQEGAVIIRKAIALCAEDDSESMATALAASYHDLGRVLGRCEEFDAALDAFQRAIRLHENLAAESPNVVVLRAHLREDFTNQGSLLEKMGRLDEAEKSYRQAFDVNKAMAEDFPSVPQYRREMAESLTSLTEVLRRAGRGDEATKILDETMPHTAAEYYCRAVLLKRDNRFEEALADINQTIHLIPMADVQSHQLRAEIFEKLARHEDAVADLTRCLEIDPSRRYIHKARARMHFLLGNFDMARADLETAIELNPQDTRALLSISPFDVATCADHGLRREWIELADRAVELNDNSAGAYAARGLILAAFGAKEEALSDIEAAFDGLPEGGSARELIVTVGRFADREEVIPYLLKLAELEPGPTHDWYLSSLATLGGGLVDSYRHSCRKMLGRFVDTEKPADGMWVAWTCALAPESVDDYEAVLRLAERAVESNADSEFYLKTLGAVLYRAGRFEEAIERLTEADDLIKDPQVSSASSPAYTWYFLAMAHSKLGQDEESGKWFGMATEWSDRILANDKQGTVKTTWNRRLTLKLLRQEAGEMIGSEERN